MKVELDVLGSPSLISLMVSMDVKAQELFESRGGHPGLPVLNKPYDFCGRQSSGAV